MSDPAARVSAVLARARAALEAVTSEGFLEAQILLGHVLGRGRGWLVAHGDDLLDAADRAGFEALLHRRCAGEPVAYILGRREFWSLDLEVAPGVLIPRADTECLVECALGHLPAGATAAVLDAGTGSGAIAIAVAVERPGTRVFASDRDATALAVAAGNAARLAPGRVGFFRGDWLRALAPGALDMILSNPPYIADGDPHLGQGDLLFEPRAALVAGFNGLADIVALAADAPRGLAPGGWLLVEHGAGQGAEVRALFEAHGFDLVRTTADLAGNERVTEGQRGSPMPAGTRKL